MWIVTLKSIQAQLGSWSITRTKRQLTLGRASLRHLGPLSMTEMQGSVFTTETTFSHSKHVWSDSQRPGVDKHTGSGSPPIDAYTSQDFTVMAGDKALHFFHCLCIIALGFQFESTQWKLLPVLSTFYRIASALMMLQSSHVCLPEADGYMTSFSVQHMINSDTYWFFRTACPLPCHPSASLCNAMLLCLKSHLASEGCLERSLTVWTEILMRC